GRSGRSTGWPPPPGRAARAARRVAARGYTAGGSGGPRSGARPAAWPRGTRRCPPRPPAPSAPAGRHGRRRRPGRPPSARRSPAAGARRTSGRCPACEPVDVQPVVPGPPARPGPPALEGPDPAGDRLEPEPGLVLGPHLHPLTGVPTPEPGEPPAEV